MERWSREGTCYSRINGPRGWVWGEVRGGQHGARKAGTPEDGTGPVAAGRSVGRAGERKDRGPMRRGPHDPRFGALHRCAPGT